jgi:hypothetical protein
LPDQANRWAAFGDSALPFDVAANIVLDSHAKDGARSDVVTASLGKWMFGTADGTTMQIAPIPLPGRDHGEALALRDHAFQQLCARLGAPAPYIRELPGKLQIAAVNWGLAKHRDAAMLRLSRGEVRALVSDRYVPLDDGLLLELVGSCLESAGLRNGARVRAVATGMHTVLRLTLPGEGVAVHRGDVIEYGIDIANSELGLRSVQVTPITYRLLCTNGLRGWSTNESFRARHIGNPQRLREHLRDAIPVALASARGDLARWSRAVDVLIDNALEEVELLRGFGLSRAETQSVVQQLSSGGHTPTAATLFDMTNAITAVAREHREASSRLRLEEIGHRYLVNRTK